MSRQIQRLPVSPGEMLWLVAGAAQLTHLCAIVVRYRYESLPTLAADQWFPFWFLPSLVATVTTVVPVVMYFSFRGWRNLFTIGLLLFAVRTLDAAVPHQYRSPDESFITASAPVLLALLAAGAAVMTLSRTEPAAWAERRLAHWTGIFVCLAPFIFFAICSACRVTHAREMFSRVLD